MLQHKKNHARKHGKKTLSQRKKNLLAFLQSTNGKIILLLTALLFACYLVFFFSPKSAVSPAPDSSATTGQLTQEQSELLSKTLNTQIPFIENQGQIDAQVTYYSQLQNGQFFLDQEGNITYRLYTGDNALARRLSRREMMEARQTRLSEESQPAGIAAQSYVLRESFLTDRNPDVTPLEPAQTTVNYFRGNDQSKWKQNLPTYNLLDLGEVYNGVKVQLKASLGSIEKIFLVQPRAEVAQISLRLEGVDQLTVNDQGELELHTEAGIFKYTKPVAWQEIDGQKHDVEVSYRLVDDKTYGFATGVYDPNYLLTIDPLLVSSYLGGANDSEYLREIMGGNNAMVIANGSLYVTAYTYSTDFPTTTGAYDEVSAGDGDVFISKISLDLGTLQASTILGGTTSSDSESIITADSSGNIIVAGNTYSTDFPGTTGKYQPALAGSKDGFIAKLNGNLTTLLAATYIGGTGADWMQGLVYDPTGYVYVALDVTAGFPNTPINANPGFQPTYWDSIYYECNIAIARLDSNLSANYYAMTYIPAYAYYGALALDSEGDLFVTAGSLDDNPVPPFYIKRANSFIPSYQETRYWDADSFVARISGDLTQLEASTYISSDFWENDFTETIAIHGSGANEQVFVIGDTSNGGAVGGMKEVFNNNPHTLDLNPSPTERIFTFGPLSTTGDDDVYILRFNRDLQTAAATVIGGSDHDPCPFLALNSDGDAYFTTSTYSTDFPTTSGAFATTGGVVMGKISNDLTQLLGSTYLGTYNGWENYSHIIVDDTSGYDIAYLLGETSSTNLPGTSGGFQSTSTGGDLYIAAFTGDFGIVATPSALTATPGASQEIDLSWTAPAGQQVPIVDYEIHYSDDGFDLDDQIFVDGVSTLTTATVTGLTNGTEYSFRVYAIDDNDEYSGSSNTATATPAGLDVPAAITDLSALPGNTEAFLDWSEPEDYGNPITSYVVHYSNDGFVSDDQTCVTASCTDTTPGADITGLVNGTLYSFRVYSVNINGSSAVSNTATTTPLSNIVVGSVEVHVSEVNSYLVFSPNVYNAVTSGMSDNALGTQDFNAFGSPRSDNYTGLVPPLSRAVRYLFYTDGAVVEHDGITYSAEDMTGATSVTLPDDGLTTNIPLGFTAALYGEAVDTIKISSNGFIYAANSTVSASNSGCCSGQNLSNLSGTGLVGDDIIVAGTWTDLYPPGAGTVKYKTVGTTPNRIFVVEFDDVSPCCDTTGGNSFQIKIFETGQTSAAPIVTSVAPDSGLATGNTNVVVSGNGFVSGASVTFGGTPASNIVVVSSTTITATTPAHAIGLVDIVVTNPDTQSDTLTGGYEYLANPPPNLNYCAGYAAVEGSYNPQTIALAADDTVWWWGLLYNFQTIPLGPTPTAAPGLENVIKISESDYDTGYALKSDGTVWAWGAGEGGELGNGANLDSDVPVQVSGLTGIEDIAAGWLYGVALKNDGTVWTWGRNYYGQLGDGTINHSNVPVQAIGLSGIEAIYVKEANNLALKNDGSLWAWGDNGMEQISTPYQVMPLGSNIAVVKPGGWHTMVLKTDGSLWTWGGNWSGQLGNGSTVGSSVPIQIASSGVAEIFAGGYDNSFARLIDEDFYAWGENGQGQLGVGSTTDKTSPTLISSLPDFVSDVFADDYNAFFVLDDGTLWAAGDNYYGQLGIGTNLDSNVPVQVSGLNGVTSVAVASNYAHALLSDGTLWGFGSNTDGQLGDSTYDDSNVPVQTNHPCANVSPDHGPYTGGTVVTLTGSGFLAGATVTFGGQPATGVTVDSATQITATTPAGTVGPVDIVVTNTDSQSSTYVDGFNYMALAPTVTAVDPDTGSSHSTTPVIVAGTNFISGATVTFGTTPATNVVFEDSTTLTVDAPPHAAGVVDVTVTNPDLQADTLAAAFTYSGTPDLQITDINANRYNPHIVTTSDGNYLIVWNDNRNSGTSGQDIYAQKIDSTTGNIIWTSYIDGREITGQANSQPYYLNHVEIAADENGGAFLVWDTNTTWSNQDIYTNYIDTDGAFHVNWESGGYPGINVSSANVYADSNPSILYDNNGGVYVSWTMYSGTWPDYNIIVTHLDGATAAPTAGWPITINNQSWDDYSQLVSAPDGGVFVVSWAYPGNQLYVRKYNSLGVLQSPFDPFYLETQEVLDGQYKAVPDGAGGVKIVYIYRGGEIAASLRVVQVDFSGSVIWDDIEIEMEPFVGSSNVYNFDCINTFEDNFYVIFQYRDESGDTYPVYARRVATDGTFSARMTVAPVPARLQESYGLTHYYLAEDGYGGIMVTYAETVGDTDHVSVSQLDTNDQVTTNTYGLENIGVGYPTLTMNGTVGAISWHGYEIIEGSSNIFARLIGSTEPNAVPTIESVVPNSGPLEGGTSITITGTNFEDGNTSVTFERTLVCQNIVVVSPTTITCTTPPGYEPGPVDVFGATSEGSYNFPDGFTYTIPTRDTIEIHTSIPAEPDNFGAGISNGDDAGTLSDINFTGAPTSAGLDGAESYSFLNGVPTRSVITQYFETRTWTNALENLGGGLMSNEDDKYSTDIPLGFTITLYGRSVDTARITSNGFVYLNSSTNLQGTDTAPGVGYSMSDYANLPDGVDGTATGDILVAGAWGDVDATKTGDDAIRYYLDSANQVFTIEFKNLEHETGAGDILTQIKLKGNGGTGDTLVPGITSIVPNQGPLSGGTAVLITGSNFQVNPPTVTLGSNPCTNLVVVTDTTLTCYAPAGAALGSVNVTVTSDDGSDSLTNGYTYRAGIGKAQWPNEANPVPVQLTAGGDGFGALSVRTSDNKFIVGISGSDIGLQKIDEAGNSLWNSGAVEIIPNATSDIKDIVADNNGGAFVYYTGTPDGSLNDHITRFDTNGNILWTAGPFGDDNTESDGRSRILFDGDDGVYIVWYVDIDNTANYEWSPRITRLGGDGAVCDIASCGVDWNSGPLDTYRQKTLPGTSLGSFSTPDPRLVLSDAGSIIISYKLNFTDIYNVKLNPDGSNDWGVDGTYVAISDTNGANYHQAESDANDGIFVSYWNDDGVNSYLKLARLDSGGNFIYGSSTGGITKKTTGSTIWGSGSSASDSQGNLFLAWNEDNGQYDLYVQKFNSSGTEQWTTGGVLMTPLADGIEDLGELLWYVNLPHNIVSDGYGGAIVGFIKNEPVADSYMATAQKILSDGTLDWGHSFVASANPYNATDDNIDTVGDGHGGALLSWSVNYGDNIASQYVRTGILGGPVINNIYPTQGPSTGGTNFFITGDNFIEGAVVSFNSVAATNVVVVSSNVITGTTPAHGPGFVEVAVTTSIDSGLLPDGFEYIGPAPTVTAATPDSGTIAGGTAVTITGTGFQAGATVDFGGIAGTNVTVDSDTQIRVTTPPHDLGVVTITVTNTDAQSGNLKNSFEYTSTNPPSLHHCVDYTAANLGWYHMHGAMSDGTVWGWGSNTNYLVGDDSLTNRISPVEITGLTGNIVKFTGHNDQFMLALKEDGTVWSWGANSQGQLGDGTFLTKTTPVQVLGLNNIIDIDIGKYHAMALKNDGTVWTWGDNLYGQVGDSTNNDRSTPAAVGGITTATAIAANEYSSHILLGNGTVWGFGYNSKGALGDNTITSKNYPVQAFNLTNVDAISAGKSYIWDYTVGHVLAHKTDGTVWAWGSNNEGQLGYGTTGTYIRYPVQVKGSGGIGTLNNVNKIFAGSRNSFAILNDGTLWGWGGNNNGILGDNSTSTRTTPVQTQGLTGAVSSVSAGWSHTLVLQTDTSVRSMGYNYVGALGLGYSSYSNFTTAQSTSGLAGVIEVWVAGDNSAALKYDGSLWVWGHGTYGTIGNGSTGTSPAPTQPVSYCNVGVSPDSGPTDGGTDVTVAGANFVDGATVTFDGIPATNVIFVDEHTITATTPAGTYGTADVKVTNPDGQSDTLVDGFTYTSDLPFIYDVTPDSGRSVGGTAVTITGENFVDDLVTAVDFDGNLCTDLDIQNTNTITCITPASTPAYTEGLVDVTITTIYGTDTLVDGFTYTSSVPTITNVFPDNGPAAGGTSVLVSGSNFTDADQNANLTIEFDGIPCTNISIAVDGNSLTCTTGAHAVGVVDVVVVTDHGTDTLISGYSYTGTPAPDLQACTGFVDIQSGGGHTLALASNGTVWAWGWNYYGQLGNNSTNDSSTPVQVSGLSGINAIFAGDNYSLALKNDGTVWAWGYNTQGQLGDGTNTTRLSPVQVARLTGVTELQLMGSHAMALRNDGTLWAWGYNAYGSLGDGTNTNRNLPVQVSGLTGVTEYYLGFYHSFAIKNDGTVWAWGNNTAGQLGISTWVDSYVPVQVTAMSDIATMSMGRAHTLAIKDDGTVWSWGSNTEGQVGNNTWSNQFVPVQVTTAGSAVEAGWYVSYLIKTDGTVWAWGDNWAGQLGDGTFDSKNIPTRALKLSGITQLDSSVLDHVLALKSDGTVWAWGDNESGEVGDGTLDNQSTPTQLGAPLSSVSKLAAYDYYSLVLRTDGTVWGWGYNGSGALGDGTYDDRLTPVQSLSATCAGITPDNGTFLGGDLVTIHGANFLPGATVTFDGLPATGVTVVNSTTITATTPAHAAGAVDVVITNPDLQTATLTDGFTYTDDPTVDSIVPNSGPSAGGTDVTLTGINYVPGATVTFGGTAATNVVVVSDTEITCTTPAHPLGLVAVTVTTVNGSGTGPATYSYVAAPGLPGEWANGGIPIDGNPTWDEPGQLYPYTVTASDGDFIVGWVREGLALGKDDIPDDDIAVQKIDRDTGTHLWPEDGGGSGGMRISDRGTTTYDQYLDTSSPTPLVPDNNGGAYMVWIENHAAGLPQTDLMLQRVGGDGTLIYGNDPRNLSANTAGTTINDYAMMSDGTGGVYVAWTGYDNLAESTQIRMKRITAAGTEYTVNTGLAFPNNSYTPRLALDSNNNAYIAYAVWVDDLGLDQVYMRRISLDGSIPALGQDWFNASPLPQVTGETIDSYSMVTDSNDDILFIYSSALDRAPYTISAQKINHNGESSLWFTPGVGGLQLAPLGLNSPAYLQTVVDSNDGAIALWQNSSSYDIYLQKIDSSGTLLWGANGLLASHTDGRSNYLRNLNSLVGDGFGGAIISYESAYQWASNRGLLARIFNPSVAYAAMDLFSSWIHLQKISSAGSLMWPSGASSDYGFTDFSDYTEGNDELPSIAGDGAGGAAVFWVGVGSDTMNYADIYGQYYQETNLPTVSSIVPNYGPTAGGTSVTISGTNFDGTSLIVWVDTDQCVNTTVVNSTTITCETPAHLAGAVDIQVVTESGAGTLTDGYSYGDDIVCTSDGINTFCGTQVIGGCPATTTGFTAGPDNFQFGSLGTRNVSSSNDTSHVEATNGAYFEETTPDTFTDTTDTLTINSNTGIDCGSAETGVTLSISATPFKNLANEDLVTYGADNLPGGAGANADYYGMLSVFTSGEATCAGACTPATGSVESSNEVKNGQNNFFANSAANDGSLSAGFDATSVLLDNTNTPNTVVLYESSLGFDGDVTIPGLDYVLAIPANIENTGSFSSTITYTIS